MLKIYFAPLQGYTEDAYRRLHHQIFGGVDGYFTPFVRLEHGQVRSKDLRDIRADFNAQVPVTPQVIAKDGAEMEQLLPYITAQGYTAVDVNMGCPFPLQTKHGRGCGMLPHPEKVQEICEVIRQHPELTFSIKMRLGLEDAEEWRKVMPYINNVQLKHVTLHPRVGTQQYKGTVDMEQFAAFMQECKHPVIYNGDITTLQQIKDLEEQFPTLHGIMMGRGFLARPSLGIEYQTGTPWNDVQLIRSIKDLHNRLLAHYETVIPGESQRLQKIQTFWDYLEDTVGRKNWKALRKAGNMKNYQKALGF